MVAPQPNLNMVKESRHSLEKLGVGYSLYLRKCSECHEHKIPGMYPTLERHQLVTGMAHNAGLSTEEESAVQAYLEAISER